MSHLLFWPAVTFFHPVGNTSAVCLTENLPPENKADVLLLACGDPRNILYTVYAEETNPLASLREFDITCCDVDVAVLARNALLFTFVADDGVLDKLDSLWNLFYHMLIDEASLSILFEQCRKLVALAESAETWRAGPYGHFLTTCDKATLAGLRRIWKAYLDTAAFSPEQAKQFEQRFMDGMKEMSENMESGNTTPAARSAGPLFLYANQGLSGQFSNYWSFGTTDDGVQSRGQDEERRLIVNPMFAFSIDGDKFSVHHGTDPLSGFHLAEAFTSEKFTQFPEDWIPTHEMVRVAKGQFSRWCTSVSRRLRENDTLSPRFIIRMFAGDALTFCQALKYSEVMGYPVTPYNVTMWRLSTITLDDHYYGRNAVLPAPSSFNVIDASNLLESVGLVNVLVVTAPLLRRVPSSTLYTQVPLTISGDDPLHAIFKHLRGDLPIMALVLGIIPSTFLSQFGTRANFHETVTTSVGTKEEQYYQRLAWRPLGLPQGASDAPQRLYFCPEDLATFLFRVYSCMFVNEDTGSQFQLLLLAPERMDEILAEFGAVPYNRRSFALLVHLAKTRIQTDWEMAMNLFEKLVVVDRRLMSGRHAYQELFCQLHLVGVNTAEWLSLPGLRDFRLKHGGDKIKLFRDWTPSCIPQVLTFVFVVSRDAIARLEPDFKEFGKPVLQCDINNGQGESWYAVTSATFGSLHISGKGEHRTGVIIEEGDASMDTGTYLAMQPPWRNGASSLIITFSVPSCALMFLGQNPKTTVGLIVRSTIAAAGKFAPQLGYELTVFRTQLTDTKRVFLLARCPVVGTSESIQAGAGPGASIANHWQEELHSDQATSCPDTRGTNVDLHIEMNEMFTCVQSFTARIDITEPGAKAALADTQKVPTIISGSGSAPSLDACIRIGAHAFSVTFPLPIDVGRAKLRVARRSSYIEVIAPLASFDVRPERDLSYRLAPVALGPDDDGTPTLGSIHRLNLDRCPTFGLGGVLSDRNWCDKHSGYMFSKRENMRLLHEAGDLTKPSASGTTSYTQDTLMHIKRTLRDLVRDAARRTGLDSPGPERVFGLCDTSRPRRPYLYLVVACMRLDVGSHTVVADAFVAPATSAVREALGVVPHDGDGHQDGSRLQGDIDMVIRYMDTDADETAAWFHLLPRLTERCRTWSHKTSCAYRTSKDEEHKSGELGLGMWDRKCPLCACGEGVGTEILPGKFESVAPYLTRAAFSPLFSVPYLQEVETPPRRKPTTQEKKTGKEKSGKHSKRSTHKTRSQDENVGKTDEGYKCRSCRREAGLACSRCKRAWYCSKACQRAEWKEHKKDCKSVVVGSDQAA